MPSGTANIKVDFSAVYSALPIYAKFRKITLPEALRDRAGKLAYRLYKGYRAHAPKKSTIQSLPLQIIKPRKGRSKAKEKRVRINAIGFTATGWLWAAARYGQGTLVNVKANHLMGGAKEHLDGLRPFIEIENHTPGSEILDKKYNVIEPAIRADEKDMEVYIERKLAEATAKFNSK